MRRVRICVPGTAANHTVTAQLSCICGTIRSCYCGTIRRRVIVIGPSAVFHPLPDIAMHIMQTESVGWETSDFDRLSCAFTFFRKLRLSSLFYPGPLWFPPGPRIPTLLLTRDGILYPSSAEARADILW